MGNQHSYRELFFFNEFDKSCEEWVEGKDILFCSSEKNTGVCPAVNRAAKLVANDFICYMNDDMYTLPGWDTTSGIYWSCG